jgi:hypothetical protein
LKKIYILIACIALSVSAYAQRPNFYKFSVGAGAGVTRVFGDLNETKNSVAAYGTADYYFTPFVTLGIEGQVGQLIGGDKDGPYKRAFKNKFMAASINAKAHLGAFLDKGFRNSEFLDVINGIYIGTGIGVIRNKVSDTYHAVKADGNRPAYDQGRDRSKDAFIPLNIGIDYALKDYHGWDRIIVNLNLQANFTFGEGLDGYDDSPVYTHNQYSDTYIFPTLGVKYKFGQVGYHK